MDQAPGSGGHREKAVFGQVIGSYLFVERGVFPYTRGNIFTSDHASLNLQSSLSAFGKGFQFEPLNEFGESKKR